MRSNTRCAQNRSSCQQSLLFGHDQAENQRFASNAHLYRAFRPIRRQTLSRIPGVSGWPSESKLSTDESEGPNGKSPPGPARFLRPAISIKRLRCLFFGHPGNSEVGAQLLHRATLLAALLYSNDPWNSRLTRYAALVAPMASSASPSAGLVAT